MRYLHFLLILGLIYRIAAPSSLGESVSLEQRKTLRRALLSCTWSWNTISGASAGMQINFQPDNTVTGRGLIWHWAIIGPRTVHFTWANNQQFMDATFGETLNDFVCTDQHHRRAVTGQRLESHPVQQHVASDQRSDNQNLTIFEKKLLRTRWTWPGPNGASERLFFQQGGIVVDPDHWVGHWEIRDPGTRTVLIRAPFGKDSNGAVTIREALLTFDEGVIKWSAPNIDDLKIGGRADGSNRIEALAMDFLDIADLILAPLNQAPPRGLRDDIIRLEEGLKDEASSAPQASPAAYDAGEKLCEQLVLILAQRDDYLHRLTASLGNNIPTDPANQWVREWAQSANYSRRAVEDQYALFRNGVRKAPAARAP